MRSVWMVILVAGLGCSRGKGPAETITLATTTSTRDSGLLDVLVPMFFRQTGIEAKVVGVGSGQALEMGRRGDADVLLTHVPEAEEQFVAAGYGEARRPVMTNDFVLVGPRGDPAQVDGAGAIVEALRKIARSEPLFISRGDQSGTHQKERSIWERAGIAPEGAWYLRAGAGMGQVLRMANEKRAYTLTDRGTFLALREDLELEILVAGDPLLFNQYAVIVVTPRKHPHVNADAARRFADFLLSPEVQAIIGRFGVEEFGEPLFQPRAGTGADSPLPGR